MDIFSCLFRHDNIPTPGSIHCKVGLNFNHQGHDGNIGYYKNCIIHDTVGCIVPFREMRQEK